MENVNIGIANAGGGAYHAHVHTDEDIATLQARLAELQTEHRDLDAVIAHLASNVPNDDLLLRRMKKRKLQIKDKITLTERLLTPDEPA